ncbi:MAG: trypsin-like peptidase domain-containing protein [Pseudomonadota bacterium]
MTQMPDLTDVELSQFRAARKRVMEIGRDAERLDIIDRMTGLVDEAEDLGARGNTELEALAKTLQDKRTFGLLLVLCLLARRKGMLTPQLRQNEIQALIELGHLGEAIREARKLAEACDSDEIANPKLWGSAMGNIGRAFKQRYIDAELGGGQGDPADLQSAAKAYLDVWGRNQNAGTTYQAINAAALIHRAARDRETHPDGAAWAREEDARQIASRVLQIHSDELRDALSESATPGDVWMLATCGEAFVAMDMLKDAAECYGAYAGHPDIQPFQLSSSLRQLEEVWGFSGEERNDRGAIVRVLKTALLTMEPRNATEDDEGLDGNSVDMSILEARLMESDLEATKSQTTEAPAGYQAFIGKAKSADGGPKIVDLEALMAPTYRARSVCAIETVHEGGWRRIGSGFVVHGDVLHPDWGGQTLIVTNHHVASGGDGMLSASFQRCRAVFVDLDPFDEKEAVHTVEFSEVLWERHEREHDTAVLRPASDLPQHVRPLSVRDVSEYLPNRRAVGNDGTKMHVKILGFPLGGPLSLSFGDQRLLDHDAIDPETPLRPPLNLDGRPIRLHYRTPTEPGSSGSPVFEAGTWKLVGIHHRGRPDTPRLPPKEGHYEANEGIWIASIRAAIAADMLPEAELFDGAKKVLESRARVASDTIIHVSKQVIGRRVTSAAPSVAAAGGPPQPSAPIGIPGKHVKLAGDEETVRRHYLRQGFYTGESLEAFRMAGGGFETVIGDDNRTQVHHTEADPFRMICSLVIRQNGGFTNYGTGFLIGRRTLVTAGHVLYQSATAPAVESIEIRPGRSGDLEPFKAQFGDLKGERYSVHPKWSELGDPMFDIGAIHLDANIGDMLGWFTLGAPPPAQLERRWAHVTGYPGDKVSIGAGRAPQRAAEMWHHATPIAAVTPRQVFYPADTFAGQSGAPVYVLDQTGEARVVAVHAYGIGGAADSVGSRNNSGVLLDESMLQTLADWRTVS